MKFKIKKLFLFVLILMMSISYNLQSQNYFQQQVNYTIHVSLNDAQNILNANEEIEYINNSPDSLSVLWFHLWPNAYKNTTTPFAKQKLENGDTRFYFAKEEERGFIDSLNFMVSGKPVKWELKKDDIDICVLTLNKPLKSGEKITIATPFRVKIPLGVFSRLGHIGQSYQISQWYPKPAVYGTNGWNAMPFLDQGEFYSEYGSFDVYITLPKNYVLGATGDLVDGEQELKWLEAKDGQTREIKSFDQKDLSFPVSSPETKTLHYHQDKVHDFAWFADKRYHVLKGEVELPVSKRKVTTWVMFTNQEAELWKSSIPYVNNAIYYYSLWNGEYPYNQATALQGALSAGGGMEYPNITIIGKAYNAFSLEQVIVHEVGHNWFYGILGSNERTHPWMDEGINSFYESRYIQTKFPDATLISSYASQAAKTKIFDLNCFKQKSMYYLAYLYTALRHEDQPMGLPAVDYNTMNYGTIVYFKSAAVFNYLKAYLGDEVFDKAMQAYFDEWKYKHPQPEDIRKVLETSTGKDLSWFFDDLINTTKPIDYKILSCKKSKCESSWSGQCYKVKVKNKGDIASPFSLSGMWNGKPGSTQWFEGFKGKKTFDVFYIDPHAVKIDANMDIPEINKKNNTIRVKGIFRKAQPLKLPLLWSIDNPDKMQLYWLPVIGFNHANRMMYGLALYNNPVFQKKLDYVLVPMYSSGTKDLCGLADAGYNFYFSKGFIHHVRLGVSGKQFSFSDVPDNMSFSRVVPSLNITFRPKDARSSISQTLKIRNINISKNELKYLLDDNSVYQPKKYDTSYFVNDFAYHLINSRVINPYNFSVDVQQSNKFVKASLEARYRVTYNSKEKGFDIRFFAGGFLWKDMPSYFDFRYRMSGTDGKNDYMYDNTFPDREHYAGTWTQQFIENDGGFKINTPIGDTWDWLAAVNLKTSIPGKLPLKIFADIGTYEAAGTLFPGSQKIIYDAGIELCIIKDIFEVYFPLAMSTDLKKWSGDNYNHYGEKIRFVFNINKLNPFEMVKNIKI